MRQLFFALLTLSFLLLTSCDDGDIITIELEFDDTLSLCGDEDSENYVVYKIKTDPFESLTLLFSGSATNDLIFNPLVTPHTGTFTINGSSTKFNYRTYDGDPSGLICEEIPSSTVTIKQDYEAASGTVTYESTFEDDDQDGISSNMEDLNNNGDFEDDDSDGDGIPNYKDADDDNDNVLTKNENPDPDGDGDIADAQNTDGTDLPDYLDTDDDNDGIITRYEDENRNQNPLDDFAPGAITARYLDATATDTYVNDNLITNSFKRTISVVFTILNTDLEILNTDLIELGTYTSTITLNN